MAAGRVWHSKGGDGGANGGGPKRDGVLCVCGCAEVDHLTPAVSPTGVRLPCLCRICRNCPDFTPDPRTLTLAQHLEACSLALQGALDEVNTYKGRDRKTDMPVWTSGDDFRGHAELLEAFIAIETLRGKLSTGRWRGREPS